MYKVIDKRETGKTKKLLMKAAAEDAIFVCGNPLAMSEKAHAYGIGGLDFWTYEYLAGNHYTDKKIYIDDVELFLNTVNHKIAGFTMESDD